MSKATSKAWQMLLDDPNRPADEVRVTTGLRVEVIEQMRADVQQ